MAIKKFKKTILAIVLLSSMLLITFADTEVFADTNVFADTDVFSVTEVFDTQAFITNMQAFIPNMQANLSQTIRGIAIIIVVFMALLYFRKRASTQYEKKKIKKIRNTKW